MVVDYQPNSICTCHPELTVEPHPSVDMQRPESMQISLGPSVAFNTQQELTSPSLIIGLQGPYFSASVSARLASERQTHLKGESDPCQNTAEPS